MRRREKKAKPVKESVAVVENKVETSFDERIITEPDFDNAEEFLTIDFGALAGEKKKI